ncbi:MAG: histidinol-phosphatase [Amphiplicatus sp.]
MKKIDFHIHTVQSNLDSGFTFCLDTLRAYIEGAGLECIAITNHNLFDRVQFDAIVAGIDVPVFPGVEIDVEGAQLLLIGDGGDLDDFERKCARVSGLCAKKGDSINVDQLEDVFGDLSGYILIPHYDKKPAIKEETLTRLGSLVTAGEVSSPKKFIYCIKTPERLVPVYFSDCRIREGLTTFSVRQTYIDCGDISFAAIKNCLRDKSKVALSENDGNSLFQVFEDGQHLSTGLNVLVGERSSGKTFTLRRLAKGFQHVRYIEQFSLVARNEEEDKKRFNEVLSQKHSLFSKDYLAELQRVVDDVIDIDLEDDERSVDRYVESLLKFAKETEKHDAFSKATLFSEEPYAAIDQKGLVELIDSTKNLIRNEEFRAVIDKHLSLNSLKALYVELMTLFGKKEEERLKKEWINDLVRQITSKLQIKTAAPVISELDPYKIAMNAKKVEKFRALVLRAREKREIMRRQQRGFELVAEVGPFEGAGEMKSLSRSQIAFRDVFLEYDDPYAFLQALKKLDARIQQAEYHKYFVKIDYRILNKDGLEASGGERSEFFLLQEIEDAQTYDMLLIDEPESSFDNLFLKNEVNGIIKDISQNMPVVLVTHNNTVGASIRPDYLLCTKKEIEAGVIQWRIYSGFPTNKELRSADGKTVKTWDVTMGCLEAGPEAYEQRKLSYEDLKN